MCEKKDVAVISFDYIITAGGANTVKTAAANHFAEKDFTDLAAGLNTAIARPRNFNKVSVYKVKTADEAINKEIQGMQYVFYVASDIGTVAKSTEKKNENQITLQKIQKEFAESKKRMTEANVWKFSYLSEDTRALNFFARDLKEKENIDVSIVYDKDIYHKFICEIVDKRTFTPETLFKRINELNALAYQQKGITFLQYSNRKE